MSEMVERVARAICGAEQMNPDDALGGWIHWQDAARAAIEAMRDPTREMLMASGLHGGGTTRGKWKAMIDEALKKGAGTTQKSA